MRKINLPNGFKETPRDDFVAVPQMAREEVKPLKSPSAQADILDNL